MGMKHENELDKEMKRTEWVTFGREVKYNTDILTDIQLRKVLHEPVGPYVVSAYTTVMHLVQAFVLAALFYMITIQSSINPIIILKIAISVGIVIGIWHHVLTNTQYGSALRASIYNTLFPVAWGFFQILLIFAVNHPIYIFTLLTIPIFAVSVIHEWDHIKKHKKPQAFKIWKGHFKEFDPQFVKDLFDVFTGYEKDQLTKVSYFLTVLAVLTVFNYFISWNLEIQTYISLIIVGIFIIMAIYFDLNRFLNNSEKLQKYGYEW